MRVRIWKNGDRRFRAKFAWRPRTLQDGYGAEFRVWLETYIVAEEFEDGAWVAVYERVFENSD